jgi:hypothetical protein
MKTESECNFRLFALKNPLGTDDYTFPAELFNEEQRRSKIYVIRPSPEDAPYHVSFAFLARFILLFVSTLCQVSYYLGMVVRLVIDQRKDPGHSEEKGEIAAVRWYEWIKKGAWKIRDDDHLDYKRIDYFNFFGTIDRLPTANEVYFVLLFCLCLTLRWLFSLWGSRRLKSTVCVSLKPLCETTWKQL